MDAQSVCEEYGFGVILKDEQKKVIQYLLESEDVMAFLPTGFGKSICYFLPPVILKKMYPDKKPVAIVISSLIGLMEEQISYLRSLGISAERLRDEKRCSNEDIIGSDVSFIFTSPEMALKKEWRSIFKSWADRICLVAVDECHCVSEWGEEFRKDYRRIACLRSIITAPFVALTATVTAKIKTDITKYLAFGEEVKCVSVLPNRKNIFLCAEKCNTDVTANYKWVIDEVVQKGNGSRKFLIYGSTINAVTRVCLTLSDVMLEGGVDDPPVDQYHSGIPEEERQRITQEFKSGKTKILVATVAFGMGMNVPDIDVVIHWGYPKSVVSYWQEVGRPYKKIPWYYHGITMVLPWYSMVQPGIPWYIPIVPWYISDVPWYYHGTPWNDHGIPWYIPVVLWYIPVVPWYISVVPWYYHGTSRYYHGTTSVHHGITYSMAYNV